MASHQLIPPVLAYNPIMQAELAYQCRQSKPPVWWRRWLTRVWLLLAVAVALILYGGEFLGALLLRDPTPIGEYFGVCTLLLIIFTLVLHFVLMFRALALGANSIAREKQGKTWDMLILTGIDAQQIVLGKWWATVQRLWREYALLGLLRASVLVWISGSTSRLYNSIYASSGSYFYGWYPILPSPLQIILAGVIVMALTMANLAFTAACGVSSSGDSRSSAMALVRAIMIRMLTLIIAAILLAWLSALLSMSFGILSEYPYQVGIALLDNGASLASELATYRSVYAIAYNDIGIDLSLAVLALGAYALLTWALLQTAQRRAIRQQALPQ